LALLQSHGFAVVLNTGRSVADARAYCRTYSLAGGLAECGSVFVDPVGQREVPLIPARAVEELARCREAIVRLPGVFVDPAYRYAIRAYRFQGQDLVAPSAAELEDVLARCGCDRLTFTCTLGDAIITPRETDKGRGLLAVKELLAKPGEPIAAMGDSDRDIPMLEVADISYAPANSSIGVRALAREGRCRVMSEPYQRGLLAAVRDLLSHAPGSAMAVERMRIPPGDLIAALLEAADRSRARHLLACLRWRTP
jgi:hydroxymethylpyrimidine pyrophosphatase-like HAD family hydrolase